MCVRAIERECVCACVCVWLLVREREENEKDLDNILGCHPITVYWLYQKGLAVLPNPCQYQTMIGPSRVCLCLCVCVRLCCAREKEEKDLDTVLDFHRKPSCV